MDINRSVVISGPRAKQSRLLMLALGPCSLIVVMGWIMQSTLFIWVALIPAVAAIALSRVIDKPTVPRLLSPWDNLFIDGDDLIIGDYRFPVENIPEIVMGRCEDTAWLQIPVQNAGGSLPRVTFSSVYCPAVEAFVRMRLPVATFQVLH